MDSSSGLGYHFNSPHHSRAGFAVTVVAESSFSSGWRMRLGFWAVLISFIFSSLLLSSVSDAAPRSLWTDSNGNSAIKIPGNGIGASAPAIADLDGDGMNEVVVASNDGKVHALRGDGSLIWSVGTPIAPCAGSKSNKLFSSPAVGPIFGDGVQYVVIGYGGFGGLQCDGGVAAFRGTDGALRWKFSTKKFSKRAKFGTRSYAVFSSPGLADTDGDGKMEIAFGSFDRNVYLLNFNGKVRWYYNAADTVFSSPGFADVIGSSRLELLTGTDISANSLLNPPTRNGGYVYAIDTAPQSPKRLAFRVADAIQWLTPMEQVVFSSPSIGDVSANNPGLEVVIGSGCFFPQGSSSKVGRNFKVLSAAT
ncbi:MAG: hypothetical protein DCC75_09505, partial [Proteobacteria bacterium]